MVQLKSHRRKARAADTKRETGKRSALTIGAYERRASKTDKLGQRLDTPLLGLFGEVGSLLSALKKKRRDAGAYFGYRSAVLEELGDVLWYLAAITRRSGISLAEVFSRARGAHVSRPARLRFEDLDGQASVHSDARFESALMQLAAEAGDIIKRFAAGSYRSNTDALQGDLIKLARPLVAGAAAGKVGLGEAARSNLEKTEGRWIASGFPPLKDKSLHVDEQIPRQIRMKIYERSVGGKKFAFQKCNGVLIGDRLTDNHMEPDDYRFHDVFHLAYAANRKRISFYFL